jgi:hypothetical protein
MDDFSFFWWAFWKLPIISLLDGLNLRGLLELLPIDLIIFLRLLPFNLSHLAVQLSQQNLARKESFLAQSL